MMLCILIRGSDGGVLSTVGRREEDLSKHLELEHNSIGGYSPI